MNTHSMESSSSLSSSLGKPPLTKTDEFSEKFHRGPKFGPVNRAFSSWKWYKGVILGYVFQPITMLNCTTCISWEIGSYNANVAMLRMLQMFGIFRKFIRFCRAIRPWAQHSTKKHCQRHNGPRNWLGSNLATTWTSCICCKFGHQMAPLAS